MVDLQIEIGYHYFRKKGVIQMEDRFLENMKIVEQAIREAGYVPCDQLYGYVSTGESAYITRQDNARALVLDMDKNELREFLKHMRH